MMIGNNKKIDINELSRKPQNGFVGRRVDGSSIFYLDVGENPELVDLMVSKDLDAWDKFCDMLPEEFDPRGQVHIDWLFVDGQPRVFH